MALIKYTGLAHFRELLPEDFKKVGVEVEEAITFARHEVTEVADDIADAVQKLVSNEFTKVRKDTKAEIRDLTSDNPPEPKVQGKTPMTDRAEPAASPAGNQVANAPAPTTTPA